MQLRNYFRLIRGAQALRDEIRESKDHVIDGQQKLKYALPLRSEQILTFVRREERLKSMTDRQTAESRVLSAERQVLSANAALNAHLTMVGLQVEGAFEKLQMLQTENVHLRQALLDAQELLSKASTTTRTELLQAQQQQEVLRQQAAAAKHELELNRADLNEVKLFCNIHSLSHELMVCSFKRSRS